ncbi:hypothetical protein LOC67_21360 [Stieleria sp. JC731]|uniref:hypothetical protein n=1 Tax=Pirellulaceae TaxID=2691357 RepID=UPI001E3499AC|nr:hypothetical protein [Stieleria sp. JC731]MCC9603106.1 hypothetical protein [Stieleria sp. JC731]
MNRLAIADLAATLASHGESLAKSQRRVSSETIMNYWTAFRTRHQQWHKSMAGYRTAKNSGEFPQLHRWWEENEGVLDDILVSELLTRVIATLGSVTEATHVGECNDRLAAVTHGVFHSQLEASYRVGQILLEATGAPLAMTVRLNRLRLGVERWSDWLVARVSIDPQLHIDYCVDRQRAHTFRMELRECANDRDRSMTGWLMIASMRDMIHRRTSAVEGLEDANAQLLSASLALFRPDLFDDYGIPKSNWLMGLGIEWPGPKAPAHPVFGV